MNRQSVWSIKNLL